MMVLNSLDGYYPSMIEIIVTLEVLVMAWLFQIGITNALLTSFPRHSVYSGYYLGNIACGFFIGPIVFGETLNELPLRIGSCSAAALGAFLATLAKGTEISKVPTEV